VTDAPESSHPERETPPRLSGGLSRRIDAVRTAAALLLLVSAGVMGYGPRLSEDQARAGVRAGIGEPVGRLDRTFAALKPFLPSTGRVGYLQPDDWPGEDAIRTFYLAEYALTPRIVTLGTAAEFLIVVPAAGVTPDTAADDPRLEGFVLVRRFDAGVLLFRRVR
jgi:hypothetical protein